jgi:hypothetical protein
MRVSPENYLMEFRKLFAEKEETINSISSFSDRVYPFKLRVLDQWLWLKGSNDEEVRLAQLAFSLSLAPISKRSAE